eukprot:TRINITY_DN4188_c0_g1_i2.p1 TRINITY_DN4188_c0_g1~~TRINITY_DN4188_c0_g1_i2.p1  ORF type:complete len:176 (-),score=17.91 TRINITY_DN4188_c0_g1_i2:311-796(-)
MAFCELQPLTPRSSTCCKPRGEETTAGSPATAGGPDPPVVPHPGAVAAFPPTADQPTLKDVMAELRSLRSDVTSLRSDVTSLRSDVTKVVTKVEELDKRQNANYLSLKLQIETLAGRVGLPKFAPAGWFGIPGDCYNYACNDKRTKLEPLQAQGPRATGSR